MSGYLIGSQAAGKMPLPPKAELAVVVPVLLRHRARRELGYDKYRRDFAKLIWQLASPKWNFDDATFERSGGRLRQSRPRRHRHPQLPLAAGPRRRAKRSTTSWRAQLAHGPGDPRADHHHGGRRQRRAASRSQRLRQEVLRQVRAPDHHRRHRPQPAAGSARRPSPKRSIDADSWA